uniref:(northern house mosquito) hypothetical protein n=1 Tax=Culex pipiens TaxID=7175 RepID=A0A8D8FKK8_CULPI
MDCPRLCQTLALPWRTMILETTTCTKNCQLSVVLVHRVTLVFLARIVLRAITAIRTDLTEATAYRASATVMPKLAIATPESVTRVNTTRPAITAISALKDTTATLLVVLRMTV